MKIQASIDIDAPIAQVFEVFTNLEDIKERITGIKSIKIIKGPAKMALGTKWNETRVMFGKEASETMEISEIQTNQKYVSDATSHGMEYPSSYMFEDDGQGTTVTMVFEGKPVTLLAKLMTPLGLLFKGATKKHFLQIWWSLRPF